MSTVTDFKPKTPETLSLEETLKEFEKWRASKTNPATPIPDALWGKLFKLAEQYPISALKNLFGISGKQYNAKFQENEAKIKLSTQAAMNQSKPEPNAQKENTSAAPERLQISDMCQVNVEKEKIEPYKFAALPTLKTMIVEFQRSDGRIMKIHTTQDSIMTLMKTFFEEK